MNEETRPPSPAKRLGRAGSWFHRDRAEYWSFVAQIVSALAVVVSLVFVGIQLREANAVAARSEANDLQTQWSALRASIYGSRDTAVMFQSGLAGEPLDAADRLRFQYLVRELAWATYQLWDRAEQGLSTRGRSSGAAADDLLQVICTPGGVAAWPAIRGELPGPYVVDLDRRMAAYASAHRVRCTR